MYLNQQLSCKISINFKYPFISSLFFNGLLLINLNGQVQKQGISTFGNFSEDIKK